MARVMCKHSSVEKCFLKTEAENLPSHVIVSKLKRKRGLSTSLYLSLVAAILTISLSSFMSVLCC